MLHGVTTTPDTLSGRISSYHPNRRMSQICRLEKDLAQRVKPMLPSMNLDCRAVLVVVGQKGRKKSHQRIMSSYLLHRSQWFSSFCQISEQPHLMLWCWLVTIMMILYINILYHIVYNIIYDSISTYYSFMSSDHLKKTPSPWTDFHLLSQPSQLVLSGFATFGMEFFCRKSLSPSRWWAPSWMYGYSLPTFFLMMSQMKGPPKFSRNLVDALILRHMTLTWLRPSCLVWLDWWRVPAKLSSHAMILKMW